MWHIKVIDHPLKFQLMFNEMPYGRVGNYEAAKEQLARVKEIAPKGLKEEDHGSFKIYSLILKEDLKGRVFKLTALCE